VYDLITAAGFALRPARISGHAVPGFPGRRLDASASFSVAKPCVGYAGQYFNVRNSDSVKALSLLNRGRLYEGEIPGSSSLTRIVCDFIGLPLSTCSTSGLPTH